MSRTELEAELSKTPCYPLKNSLFVGKIPCSFQTRIFAETAAGRMFFALRRPPAWLISKKFPVFPR